MDMHILLHIFVNLFEYNMDMQKLLQIFVILFGYNMDICSAGQGSSEPLAPRIFLFI
jgi:hypothetical protein